MYPRGYGDEFMRWIFYLSLIFAGLVFAAGVYGLFNPRPTTQTDVAIWMILIGGGWVGYWAKKYWDSLSP